MLAHVLKYPKIHQVENPLVHFRTAKVSKSANTISLPSSVGPTPGPYWLRNDRMAYTLIPGLQSSCIYLDNHVLHKNMMAYTLVWNCSTGMQRYDTSFYTHKRTMHGSSVERKVFLSILFRVHHSPPSKRQLKLDQLGPSSPCLLASTPLLESLLAWCAILRRLKWVAACPMLSFLSKRVPGGQCYNLHPLKTSGALYTRHTNCSASVGVPSLPTPCRSSGYCRYTFQQVFFPSPPNEETVSHPDIEWKPSIFWIAVGESCLAMSWTG